jgi:hypothetical protein
VFRVMSKTLHDDKGAFEFLCPQQVRWVCLRPQQHACAVAQHGLEKMSAASVTTAAGSMQQCTGSLLFRV